MLLSIMIIAFSCEKAMDRRCYKSTGETDSLIYELGDIYKFDLGNKIKYRIFQDSTNQLVVKGGKNLINLVDLNYEGDTLILENQNRCNFLRKKQGYLEVDIHYEDFHMIRCDPTDSLLFMDTIRTEDLDITLIDGGGFMDLAVDVNQLRLDVTGGVTHFNLGGKVSGVSRIFVKILSYGDARTLESENYLISNNSTGDFYVNLDEAYSVVKMWGTGNVWYTGTPDSLIIDQKGDGLCLPL